MVRTIAMKSSVYKCQIRRPQHLSLGPTYQCEAELKPLSTSSTPPEKPRRTDTRRHTTRRQRSRALWTILLDQSKHPESACSQFLGGLEDRTGGLSRLSAPSASSESNSVSSYQYTDPVSDSMWKYCFAASSQVQ